MKLPLNFIRVLAVLAVLTGGFMPLTAQAAEQVGGNPVVIAVLDLEQVVQKSTAGQSITSAIKVREDSLKKEADGYKKSLRAKEVKLVDDRKAGQNDKDFDAAKKAFEQDVKKSQQAIVDKGIALEKSKLEALKNIQSEIAKITADIADEKKLQIVVDRKFVVIAEQSLDITDEVLRRLNDKVKSIPLR